jgi:hypothetical protein
MKLDTHGRVPYQHLTEKEREALHNWCRLHDIDHTTVPIDTRIERMGDEWELDVYDQRDGAPYLGPRGVVMLTIRRPFKADLPWRAR